MLLEVFHCTYEHHSFVLHLSNREPLRIFNLSPEFITQHDAEWIMSVFFFLYFGVMYEGITNNWLIIKFQMSRLSMI